MEVVGIPVTGYTKQRRGDSFISWNLGNCQKKKQSFERIERTQVEFCFIFIKYCFEFCDRLFPKYAPMCFIEVCVHLYLSSLPSCVLSYISLPSTEVSDKSHVIQFQPIRGKRRSCLQLLNISHYWHLKYSNIKYS